jgi:hypothetical protein
MIPIMTVQSRKIQTSLNSGSTEVNNTQIDANRDITHRLRRIHLQNKDKQDKVVSKERKAEFQKRKMEDNATQAVMHVELRFMLN